MQDFDTSDHLLPYNPSDVNIRRLTFAVGQIMDMMDYGDIDFWRDKAYQRNPNSWSIHQKSRLIESLIMRIPLPMFYFDGSEERWKVIDGLHRLTTFYEFLKEPGFKLSDLEYLKDLEDLTFYQLPFSYQRIIRNAQIEAYVINPGTPSEVKLNIFKRINTGGTSLSRQEIRNTYYRGQPANFINRLAESGVFIHVTRGKIRTTRMRDREVVLRFVAFYLFADFYNPPMEDFLDKAMERLEGLSPEKFDEVFDKFEISLNVCDELFGDKAFYLLNVWGEKIGSSINISLLEAWTVNVAKLNNAQIKKLELDKENLLIRFNDLLQSVEFYKSVSASTSSKKAVSLRFFYIKSLIENLLNAN
jgi:hypothetical protein